MTRVDDRSDKLPTVVKPQEDEAPNRPTELWDKEVAKRKRLARAEEEQAPLEDNGAKGDET